MSEFTEQRKKDKRLSDNFVTWTNAESALAADERMREAVMAERGNTFHCEHTLERAYRYSDGIFIRTCSFCQSVDAALSAPGMEVK